MTSTARQRVPRLVFTGTGDNIFTLTPTDGQTRQLTWSWEDIGGGEAQPSSGARLTHAWPTWAPDESRVACFGLRKTGEEAVETSVYAVAADGVESWELAPLSGGMPIYGNWSPRADAFAALVQRGERNLALEVVSLAQPGKTTALVSGAPLFWSWSRRGDRIAVHVGGGRSAAGARVLILDATSGEILRQVSDSPGDFRVPAWSPQEDLLAYAEQKTEDDNTLYLLDVASNERAPVATAPGTITALWSADGRFLAFGGASREGTVMLSWIKVLDLESGRIQSLVDEPVAGFFWSPCGDTLLYVSVDAQRSHLCWHRANRETGERAELVRFLPSREQTLIFSFFDQYACSHPPVAPDGSTLAFVGYLMGKGPLETTASAQVYLLPLDPGGGTAKPVGTGQFACWNPS